jgi:predicted O-methyltransferase YrrM
VKISDLNLIKAELNTIDVQVLQKYVQDIKKPNCYVEIGTREGGSALFARIANKDVDIYAIDPKPILDSWNIAIEKFGIRVIIKESIDIAEIWTHPIGVLFIDGDHTTAYDDFIAWEKYVVKGGIVIFHDYGQGEKWSKVVEDCDRVIEEYKDKYELILKPDFNNPVIPPSSLKGLPFSVVVLKKK